MTNRRGPQAHRHTLIGQLGTLATALAIAGTAACGGEQKPGTVNPGTAGNVAGAPPVDRSRCKAEGKHVVTADLNGDNKADVWKYYVPNGQGADVIPG